MIKIPQGSPEFEFEKYKTMRADRTAHVQAHLASLTTYANTVLRGLFLLNGVVGLAAFLRDSPQAHALKSCAWGALAVVAASMLSYLSQRLYMTADLRTCDQDMERLFGLEISKRASWEEYWLAIGFASAACFVAAVSLGFFCHAIFF